MSALALIWTAALAMCGGSLGWMLMLIALRARYARAAVRRAADRHQVGDALVSLLLGRCDLQRDLGPYRRRARLMAETLLEFLALVRGADRETVLAACRTLGVDAAFRRRLTRGSLAGRLACIEALAAFPGAETEQALVRAAAGPKVRLAALKALKEAGGPLAIDAVVADLQAGRLKLSGLAAEFVRALAALDVRATLAALQERSLTPAIRALLLDGLGGAADYGALPELIAHTKSPAPAVRAAAVRALGRLMHPAAEPCLAQALEDGAWEVRSMAAMAIGGARFSSLAPQLAGHLADPVWHVRCQAAVALAQLGDPGRDQLRLGLASSQAPVRSAAALALAEPMAA